MKEKQSNKELWQTAYNWLLLCGNKINNNYCKEEITTHPDYPALISVVDFLDSGGMDYNAIKADASYIHEFNYPLLAHIRQPGQEYMHLINDAAVWDKQKEITEYWTGIVVYPGKNANWKNRQNKIYQQNALKNKIIAAAWVITGVALFIVSTSQFHNLSINVFGFLSLLGLLASIFLLGTELGFQSQIIKQVCGAVSNGGCEKILKSRYAVGFAGITPADASVLYFTSQFIVYLLGCWYVSLFTSIILLAFTGIAIAVWSIYTQAVKLKQWCALCLGIVAVLVLQSIAASFIIQHFILNEISSSIYVGLGVFFALYFVLVLVLLPIKQLIKTNSSNKLKLTELKKWKLDADMFINQWKQEQEVDTVIWEDDLLIGNPFAPLLITVACNPYCGPCAQAHKQLDNLLQRFANKLKVQIRLLCNSESENNKRTIAVKAILQKATTIKSNNDLQQMLTDWFDWMNYEKWNDKWKPDNTIDINKRLQQHSKWIEDSSIVFTPTFFINGKKLPGRYSLDDIEILIPHLADIIADKETIK
ncbi:MAG: vitamin K epoxide reductase family protein [Sediminibacterium sp.]|nr:vitamin K epoxide reductase family protein [Sediminibacterium sp.]